MPRQSTRLAEKKARIEPPQAVVREEPPPTSAELPDQPTLPREKKQPKTAAQRSREWRERKKANNPEAYAAYMERQRVRSKENREAVKLDPVKLENRREKTKLCSRVYREKHAGEKKKKIPMTRAALEERRAYWRAQKAKWFAQMHRQQLRRINEARRKKRAERRAAKAAAKAAKAAASAMLAVATSAAALVSPTSPQPGSSHDNPAPPAQFPTFAARRKALSRARAALPTHPQLRQSIICSLQKASRDQERQRRIGEEVLKSLKSLKRTSRTLEVLHARKVLRACCFMQMRQKHRQPKLERGRNNARILDFFHRVAVPVPEKKKVLKSGAAPAVLAQPLVDLHKEFLKETGCNTSFSTFAKCRPAHIRTMQHNRLRQCLCEYCTNVGLKLKEVEKVAH